MSPSYGHQSSTTDQRPERRAQSTTTQHRNQYQFIPLHPLSPTPDAARYNHPTRQNQFDSRPPQTLQSPRVTVHMTAYYPGQALAIEHWLHTLHRLRLNLYIPDLVNQYPSIETHDEHQSEPTDYLTPGLDVGTTRRISHPVRATIRCRHPALARQDITTSFLNCTSMTKDNKAKSKLKHQNTETGDDDDEDLVSPSANPSLSRPPIRL